MKHPTNSHGNSFLAVTALLVIFGLLLVYDASIVYSLNTFGSKYHFIFKQLLLTGLGIVGFLFASKVNLEFLKKFSFLFLVLSVVFLLAVLIPGIGSKYLGARRWINLGFTSFQPSELAKLSFIIYFSFWAKKIRQNSNWLLFVGILGLLVGLVLLEPDFGTSLVLGAVGAFMYFISGAPLKHFAVLGPLVIVVGFAFILISPYRRERLLTFIKPHQAETLQEGYHTNQALIAIGSGGAFGVGPGKSRQKYSYLPEVTTDSIFAILCEELGFVGAMFYLSLLGSLTYFGFKIAQKAGKEEYKLLAAGTTFWVTIQSMLNLAAISGLVPLTGVPLPLISYGGSAIIFLLVGLGLVVNVSRK